MNAKIAITHVVLSLDVGGMERNVINQIREGRKLGQAVSVLCVERPGALAGRAEELGARVICVHKRAGFRPGIARPIRSALRRLSPDVVHTHQIGPLFYTGLAAVGVRGLFVVHTEHGRVNYAGRRRTRWLGRMAARSARVFYCLSQDMADGVIAAGVVSPSKVRVIRNGIETALYRRSNASRPIRQSLGIPDGAPLIGTVGRLNEIKRQDLLMEAFDIVLQSYPDAHLLLVGDGPQRRLLEERAAGTSRPERIHFAGYQADTTPYLHAMDLFALPSRSEGMPQALLEACVAEKPVIASRVGGIPEVIEHEVTGILVEPGSAPTLATGIRRLLADPSLSAQMALRASAKVVAMFDVSRMAREYHRDFLDLLRMPPKGVDLLTDVN